MSKCVTRYVNVTYHGYRGEPWGRPLCLPVNVRGMKKMYHRIYVTLKFRIKLILPLRTFGVYHQS